MKTRSVRDRRAQAYITLLLLGILAGGCAVLTVDVDVYKGPLSNERVIQVKQVASMAMAAKPLLVNLRDWMEWPDPDVRRCMQGRAGVYKAGAIVDTGTAGPQSYGYHFLNERARRINGILGLYDDSIYGPLTGPVRDVRDAIQDVLANAELTPPDVKLHRFVPATAPSTQEMQTTKVIAGLPDVTAQDIFAAQNFLLQRADAAEFDHRCEPGLPGIEGQVHPGRPQVRQRQPPTAPVAMGIDRLGSAIAVGSENLNDLSECGFDS